MKRLRIIRRRLAGKAHTALCLVLAVACGIGPMLAGCATPSLRESVAESELVDHPRELSMASIPPYRVEPPDILQIELVSNIRPADDPLHAGDELVIRGSQLLPTDPMGDPVLNEFKQINNSYMVQSDGTVDLGPEYGSVVVDGLTVTQAKDAILRHLRDEIGLRDPKVAVNMPDVSGKQTVTGEHLVRPDGTVNLGIYGSVYVAGMTLDEVKRSVEDQLAKFIHDPEVTADVLSYNSKNIYIITDGGGTGETVAELPFTGNDTVLSVIAQIQGISEVSSKTMWIARPAPNGAGVAQTMQIDWRAITMDGVTTTNYQLLPGDRVYIQADQLIATDNFIAKVITPFQRLFGFTILGYSAVSRIGSGPRNSGGSGFGGGGGFF